ncbi:MAG: zinc-ribbon domain-containing protein, partial [Ruminiclostridium sp.]|nr:zinc-ribbon domain-containing protein [Ruminiclostridium sp.]
MSKICTNCGGQIADGAGFCPNCGTAAPPDTPTGGRFCPSCGAPLNPGAAFCDKCGAAQNNAQAAPQAVQQVQPVQPTPPPVQPVQQPMYTQPVQPQYQQPVQPQTTTQQQVQQVMQNYSQPAYQQPVQPMYQAPQMQPGGSVAVKQKKSRYPLIITIIAVFLAITLVVVLIFNPFGSKKSPLGEKLEASFSKLCDMTKLGTQSYALARLLTEELLETDLASADPDTINSRFDQCLDAWKATEEVSNNMISMSEELAKDENIKKTKGISTKISAMYAAPDLVDMLFPFTVRASAANEGDITTEVSEAASPADSVEQCSTLGVQILSDSHNGYNAVMNLRSIYSGRTTPVQDWNNAVNTIAGNFTTQFYVSGEITSGAFTQIPNGTHSVHTLSQSIKGGTLAVSNTDILVDVGSGGSCIVYGTTCGLTFNQDQFPDYHPSEGSRSISMNTYPENPGDNGITFHATSFFSWFRIDRVGGFTITRGNKGEGSVTDPPVVQNTGGNTNPPENNRGPITDFIPPTTPPRIRDTSSNITNPTNNNNNGGNNNNNNDGGGNSQPPITPGEITVIAGDLGAGVGPITVTLAWQTHDDLDLHMITPDGSRIYYRNKTAQGGTLD